MVSFKVHKQTKDKWELQKLTKAHQFYHNLKLSGFSGAHQEALDFETRHNLNKFI